MASLLELKATLESGRYGGKARYYHGKEAAGEDSFGSEFSKAILFFIFL